VTATHRHAPSRTARLRWRAAWARRRTWENGGLQIDLAGPLLGPTPPGFRDAATAAIRARSGWETTARAALLRNIASAGRARQDAATAQWSDGRTRFLAAAHRFLGDARVCSGRLELVERRLP
jgi:hypothetical protein